MRVLLTGASGAVGSVVAQRLLAAGHEVIAFSLNPPLDDQRPGLTWCSGDFARRTRAKHWRSELPGVDAVINTVGIFRERFLQSFSLLHDEAPAALFTACANYGVKRVIHLSALGAAEDAPTDYWRSKAKGDAKLLAHTDYERWIVRPSLIYAPASRHAALLRNIAALPVLVIPQGAGLVQPIHVDDLADLIVRLASHQDSPTNQGLIAAVGPQILTWGDWLETLRLGMGLAAAPRWQVPRSMVHFAAWLAEGWSRHSPMTVEGLTMMMHTRVGDAGDVERVESILERALKSPKNFTSHPNPG